MSSSWGRSSLAALALRVWDPTPVARLRSLVFDAYQRLEPARLRSRAAGAHRRYRRGIAEAGRAMALAAHGACRPRRQARREAARRRSASTWCSPSPTACRRPTRCASGRNRTLWPRLRRRSRSFPANDQVFAEAIGKAPVVLGFIAAPQGDLAARDQSRLRPWRRRSRSCSRRIIRAPRRASKSCRTRRKARARSTGSPSTTRSSAACPCWSGSATRSIPRSSADMLRLAQGASTYMVKSSGASGEKAFGEKTGIVAVKVGDFEVPTEANGQMWIRFTPESKERYLPGLESSERRDRRRRARGPHPHHRHERGGPARSQSDAARRLGARRLAARPGHRADPARRLPATARFRHARRAPLHPRARHADRLPHLSPGRGRQRRARRRSPSPA